MDDQRLGQALRAVRIRRNWTQRRLAEAATVSASLVSLIERGHLDTVSLRALRRVAASLDTRLEIQPRTRAGDLDRLLNAGHARLHEEVARLLDRHSGWLHVPEVSFAVYGERGVIDVLAFHPGTASLLVIELKTELVSLEDLMTTMDVRVRLGPRIAADRGWRARSVSSWVVIADTRPNRRRAAAHAAALRSAFPGDGHDVRRWLRSPGVALKSLSFWPISNGGGANQLAVMRRRVRLPSTRHKAGAPSS